MSLDCLFSTYVHYKNNLNVDNEALKEFAYKVEKSGSFYRKMSNVGGFQTMDIQNLQHDIPPFKKLINEIVSEANVASKHYKINNRIGLSQIWININRFKDFNIPHIHRDAVFSGVYYVNVQEESRINFRHPSPLYGYAWSKLDFGEHFADSYDHWPKNGELLIFPSWLTHYVPPNTTQEDRISISFDLV